MPATYTWDVFSTVDGFGSHDGTDWGGYWGKQGPELLARLLAQYDADQRLVFGANTYRTWMKVVASIPDADLDPWAIRMRNLPATVISTTLQGPSTGPTPLSSAAMPST